MIPYYVSMLFVLASFIGWYLAHILATRGRLKIIKMREEVLKNSQNEFEREKATHKARRDFERSMDESRAMYYKNIKCKNTAVEDLRKMLSRDEKLPVWLTTQLNLCFLENDDLPAYEG